MNGPLENELKERNESLETATERLSDRELEISILQKRLEIRSSVSKKGPNKINCLPDHQDLDLTKCSSCTRKDGLIRWSTCPIVFFQLAVGSRGLSQAEKEISTYVCKSEQIHKMTTIITQNDTFLYPGPF